jgi:hypothetical protein
VERAALVARAARVPPPAHRHPVHLSQGRAARGPVRLHALLTTQAKIWFTIGALVAGLLGAEVVARLTTEEPVARPRVEGRVFVRSADPDLRTENEPLARQVIVYPQRDGTDRRVVAHVNEKGWRGPVVPIERRPGVLRIAALGDSHTFGHGVGDDETWAAVLERELDTPARPVEVMNCGVNGYDADQVVALLEKRVLPYEPDLVVYGFFCNDAAIVGAARSAGTPLEPAPSEDVRTGAIGWLRDHSLFADVVAAAAHRRAAREHWADRLASLYGEECEGWKRMRASLRGAHERLAARGTRLVVILIPLLVPVRSELVGSAAHRTVGAFCRSVAIPCFDLEPAFANLDVDALRVHPLDLHAGPEAHRRAGEAVARWLRDEHHLE